MLTLVADALAAALIAHETDELVGVKGLDAGLSHLNAKNHRSNL